MAFDPAKPLDDTDWAILHELQTDARVPFSELGRRVSLSAPAVADRVRRLEDAGVIRGYQAQIDLKAVGLPIEAIIRARDDKGTLRRSIDQRPEVLDAVHVTGEDCWIVRVAVPDMETLEDTVGFLGTFGMTTTSLVFSSPIRQAPVTRDAFGEADEREAG
jgi:Lrp/AsnC family transcriptional regulator, leucine-responsive regulatory protein